MVKGTFRADGLAILEIDHISFLAGAANPRMKAKVAFIKTDSGATLGWTEHTNWSKETLERLAALRDSMENDVAALYLTDAATTHSAQAAGIPLGIAEHLGTDEAPSF